MSPFTRLSTSNHHASGGSSDNNQAPQWACAQQIQSQCRGLWRVLKYSANPQLEGYGVNIGRTRALRSSINQFRALQLQVRYLIPTSDAGETQWLNNPLTLHHRYRPPHHLHHIHPLPGSPSPSIPGTCMQNSPCRNSPFPVDFLPGPEHPLSLEKFRQSP